MKKLENQVILVTGGSRGIGESIVKLLFKEGASIAFTYCSGKEKAQKIFDEIQTEINQKNSLHEKDKSQNPLMLKMDVSKADSIQEGIHQVVGHFGKIDGLVNNAGVTRDRLLLRMSEKDFDEVIETNLKGCFLCTKATIQSMLRTKKSGSIVNITSVIGQTGNAGQSNYSASKAGIEGFTRSIAREVGSRGIRLNCVAPGYIQTAMTENLTEKQKQEILFNRVPMKRLGLPKDVAYAVLFLLSRESSYITGQTINVNGGMYM